MGEEADQGGAAKALGGALGGKFGDGAGEEAAAKLRGETGGVEEQCRALPVGAGGPGEVQGPVERLFGGGKVGGGGSELGDGEAGAGDQGPDAGAIEAGIEV